MVNNQQAQTEAVMVTAGQAARLLMLTPRRLRQLAEAGHIPGATRGRYPLAATIQGYLKFLRESIERRADDNAGASLASAKEKEIRLRLRQREAELIDADDAEAFHAFSSRLYRDELASVGKTVSRDPILAGQINAALTAALNRFDARFAEAFPKLKRRVDPLTLEPEA